jgi:hypothetical protein
MVKEFVWVIGGTSESGDHFTPLVFKRKPNKKKLSEIAHSWDGDENFEGCGDYGSYVYLKIDKVEVQ